MNATTAGERPVYADAKTGDHSSAARVSAVTVAEVAFDRAACGIQDTLLSLRVSRITTMKRLVKKKTKMVRRNAIR